jgi:microcompartment protein CcmK/EutM
MSAGAIAFDEFGAGPSVILVSGGSTDRMVEGQQHNVDAGVLAPVVAEYFRT